MPATVATMIIHIIMTIRITGTTMIIITHSVTIHQIALEGTATDTKGSTDEMTDMIDAMGETDEKNEKIADGSVNI
ncbi:MAG: hypothetical protein A2Y81_02470 [Nitrospirae bacterium RBG_13_43_8]|nr:MAG: hypothetical protein A2Y81_02470 [Nitrospirae bacterium RBG_13_43_8]